MAEKKQSSVTEIIANQEKQQASIDKLAELINKLIEKQQTDSALTQTQLEEIKEQFSQYSKASTGAKRAVKSQEEKPAEDGEKPATKSGANTTAKSTAGGEKNTAKTGKTKAITQAQFFAKMAEESEEFKKKYDNAEIEKQITTGVKKTRTFRAITTLESLKHLKSDFEKEYEAFINKPSEKAEQVKDDEL